MVPFLAGLGGFRRCAAAPPPRFARSPSPRNRGEEFEVALAAFEVALAGVREVERASAGLGFADAEALQGEYDARLCGFEAALRGVMIAPAPDAAAVGRKILLAIDHDLATLEGGEEGLAVLREDVERVLIPLSPGGRG